METYDNEEEDRNYIKKYSHIFQDTVMAKYFEKVIDIDLS